MGNTWKGISDEYLAESEMDLFALGGMTPSDLEI